jgi:hypothetical protein
LRSTAYFITSLIRRRFEETAYAAHMDFTGSSCRVGRFAGVHYQGR